MLAVVTLVGLKVVDELTGRVVGDKLDELGREAGVATERFLDKVAQKIGDFCNWIQGEKSQKEHEDATYGKARSILEKELGRKLTKEEAKNWEREMGKLKKEIGPDQDGRKNKSLPLDKLIETGRDALNLEP